MANDSLTSDQVIAEAKSAEITKQQDQILQSNPTAADLSEINDKRVPDPRRGRHKFKMTISLNAKVQTLLQMWSPAKPPS